MKPGLKKRWSILPARRKVQTASRFSLFSRVRSAGLTPGDAPVHVNVYDLTPANGYFYWAGLGIFHSGIEVHGVEYAFGAHDYPTSGVFEVEPRQCPGFKFRKSIFMGTTRLDPLRIREFMERHAAFYKGNTYHLVFKNCNHFCKDVCYRLTGNSIPEWVNRLARIVGVSANLKICVAHFLRVKSVEVPRFLLVGPAYDLWKKIYSKIHKKCRSGSVCSCILPERFSAVQHDPAGYESCDSEKKKLRSAFGCMSSISMGHLSVSSPFLSSPSKDDSLVRER